VRAERPAAEAADAQRPEAIPAPASPGVEQQPTIAPPGPAVEPAPPAHDQREVPAAATSGRPILRPVHSGHTT